MQNRAILWAVIGAAGLAVVGGVEMLCGVRWVRGGLGLADQGGGFCSSAMLWAAETPGQPPGPEPKPQSPAQTKAKLLPLPTPEEIRRAEKAVEEVFGRDMAKAKTASDKAKLAGEILKTAREEKDQAVRFVLAQRAKQLAVQAQDAKLAVQAAEILASYEPTGGPIPAKAAADKAHGLWAKGEFSKGAQRLSYWIEAAELYLRTLDDLEGFEKTIAERRLKELGWSKYVFAFEFEKDTEGWQSKQGISGLCVQNGRLCGRITGDPYMRCFNLHIVGSERSIIEICMAITAGKIAQIYWVTEKSPLWDEAKHLDFDIIGDGQFHTYIIPIGSHPKWANQIIQALRIDPADWNSDAHSTGFFAIEYIRGR